MDAQQRAGPTRARRRPWSALTYQDIIDRFGNTKQASVARQQLENLRGS